MIARNRSSSWTVSSPSGCATSASFATPRACARSTSASRAAVGAPDARSRCVASARASPRVGIARSIVAAMVTLADVEAARVVVDRYLPRAPIERSPYLSQLLGAEILLKIETFKPTRTFKVRGALNKIASLDDAARRRGVVAASAGSHAQGVAFAASALGAPSAVVMPRGVSETIVRVCRAYGADVLLEGDGYDDTLALAHRIERDEGKTFVHPYADPLIIAGQGTIGLEILDDLPDVELVIVAVGGGGLITGIALALRGSRPGEPVVGVEPQGPEPA